MDRSPSRQRATGTCARLGQGYPGGLRGWDPRRPQPESPERRFLCVQGPWVSTACSTTSLVPMDIVEQVDGASKGSRVWRGVPRVCMDRDTSRGIGTPSHSCWRQPADSLASEWLAKRVKVAMSHRACARCSDKRADKCPKSALKKCPEKFPTPILSRTRVCHCS